jgi:UDP-N-acetylmuramate--alanine ligase
MGGIGMSALALILAERGHSVSGSDRKLTPAMQALETKALVLFQSQISNNFTDLTARGIEAPLVVVSTAIPSTNPELIEAQRLDLTIWHRSDLLAWLIEQQPSIAVAGSHGKTTTSTVVTTLLATVGEDPTAVIGGVVPCFGSNGHTGNGRLLVAEADESDGSLVKFRPQLGLITNLELDHTDHYDGLDDLINTMRRFADGCDQVLANRDCPILREHVLPDAWWSVTSADGVDFAALPLQLGWRSMPRALLRKRRARRGLHAAPTWVAQPQQRSWSSSRLPDGGVPFERLVNGLTALKPPRPSF